MKKQNLSTFLLVLVFFAGLSMLLYPTVSDWWNSRVQTQAITDYEAAVAKISWEDYEAEFEKADAYNRTLKTIPDRLFDGSRPEGYEEILNVAGNGVMGYIEIPKIGVKLPVYHGTLDSALSVGAGHLEGTSLPVGGEGTHAVLSAHRGLPSATLFSNLDRLAEGDTFCITVLDRLLTYEVDQIRIVEPDEAGDLAIEEGKDYLTLLTCTPYGVNTHRLLVRGHRVENADVSEVVVVSEAYEMDSTLLAPIVAAPLLLILLVILLVKYRKPRGENRKPEQIMRRTPAQAKREEEGHE